MKLERSNVDFPLWRKKVDKSLFEHNGTHIPSWACEIWGIAKQFENAASKKDPQSNVTIRFGSKKYVGWVVRKPKDTRYRLFFDPDCSEQLKDTFLMSYMRSMEEKLDQDVGGQIEDKIPFWEFLDIEFDASKREFRFTAHYTQKPSFPNLFQRLIGSPSLKQVADEIDDVKKERIYKQSWKPREELNFEIGAKNVLYYLLNTTKKLFYVGEAKDLVKRLNQPHPTINEWDYFRYNVLPPSLDTRRVLLERMMIRDMAAIFSNKKVTDSVEISDYSLANDKIDK
jgi:hypothetical protein